MFDRDEVGFDALQEPHRHLTRAAAGRRQVVLWIHDTTTLSFNHHRGTEGLGPTSQGGRGMLLHSSLAVDVSGGVEQPPFLLGLGHQQLWIRGKNNVPTPESAKWAQGIAAVGRAPQAVRWVHVGDSESDCWEAIEACVKGSVGFALRACQNRRVIQGDGPIDASGEASQEGPLLFDLLAGQPSLGNKKLWVRARGDREARWATLEVSALPITLPAPKNWADKPHRKGLARPQPIRCWALRVYEINAPAGEDPIEWVILTDEPVRDWTTALKVVFWYSCRWLIEEYHKCLKTGCRIEARQLEEAKRLEALVGILSVVAVRLLQLKHQAKVNPDLPASKIVPPQYVQTLAAHLNQPWRKMTTREFWRETARLGGFLGRKSDGDPGWLTLWRGWQDLELLTTGYQLARREQ